MKPDIFAQGPIAILCSGGDAPGMNPLIRALARIGLGSHGIPVLGIMDGYSGLVRLANKLRDGEITIKKLRRRIIRRPGALGCHPVQQEIVLLDNSIISGLVVQGGTKLRASRCKVFERDIELRKRVIELLRALGVRALVVAGGDGSLRGAERLLIEGEGSPLIIGIPCTIDNDFPLSDASIGLATATATIVNLIKHLKDTARSHQRVIVLETMGRECGELTVRAALASGAEHAVIPEHGFFSNDQIRELAEEIERSFERGRSHTIVLVAEGVKMDRHSWESPAWKVADQIGRHLNRSGGKWSDIETRATVLGHTQRGGSPVSADSTLAAEFAAVAVKSIMAGQSGITVQIRGEHQLVSFGSPPSHDRGEKLRHLHQLLKEVSQW